MSPDSTQLLPAASWARLGAEPAIDLKALRAYRLEQVRRQLRALDYGGILLYDPVNIRYALDTRNMSVWTMHNAVRYAFVATEGPVVMFDFHGCDHLSEGRDLITEVRGAKAWFYFGAGARVEEIAKAWADELAELMAAHGGGNRRLAVDKCDPEGIHYLQAQGLEIKNGQSVMEQARLVKSPEELTCLKRSVEVCHAAMSHMRAALEPGVTENEIWAILNHVNAANDGEWIETRLLTSGPRTNPWFRESSNREIESGDLLSFDTDMVGPFGYCADISRTYYCGPGKPPGELRSLYRLAWEQIHYNIDLLKPGLSYRELTETAFRLPDSCKANRYSVVAHGVGMCDEYPSCYYPEDYAQTGYDGQFLPGHTLCIESYIGEAGGSQGVKLEQMLLVTETGVELLSDFPFEDELLDRHI
ncbi:MAG: Xaa-Pro peptidase family protein [Pseudomonadota bacterium]